MAGIKKGTKLGNWSPERKAKWKEARWKKPSTIPEIPSDIVVEEKKEEVKEG